jgi:hypothetical protein
MAAIIPAAQMVLVVLVHTTSDGGKHEQRTEFGESGAAWTMSLRADEI